MKTRILTIMVVVLALLLAACGQPTVPDVVPTTVVPVEPTQEPAPEPFALTWWTELGRTCCSDTRSDIIPRDIEEAGDLGEWLIDGWHELHPEYNHVTIEMILADTSNENAILRTRIAAGDTPHIIEGFAGRVGTFREVAVPLEEYFTQEMVDDYLPGRWEGLFHDGHVLMISAVGAFYYPVVNTALFEQAGVEVPEPWHQYTWEEFKEIGASIKTLDGAYLSCFFSASPGGLQWDWEPFAGAGVSMFEDGDFSRVAFNTPAAVSMLEELVEIEKDGYLVPNPPGLNVNDCVEYWKEGKVAVFFSNLTSGRSFMKAAVSAGVVEKEWEVIPLLPIAYGSESPLFVGGYNNQGIMITDATPELWREAAFSFAQYVSVWPFMQNGALRLPLLQSQLDRGAMPSDEEKIALDYMFDTGLAECGFSEPVFNTLRQLWVDEVTAAFLGVKTAEQAMGDFEAAANAEIQ